MDGGAVHITALDRFTLRAPKRRDSFELIGAHGDVLGSVTGDLALRLHGEVVDADGSVILQSRPPEIYGEDRLTAALLDGSGAVIGSVAYTPVHRFRERWVVSNPVAEPVAVIEEDSKIGALISTWDWPMPRRYTLTVPRSMESDTVEPGSVIGRAHRSATGRSWSVAITHDDETRVARRQVLAAFAVIAMNHAA